MIDGTGHPADTFEIPIREETAMFKTISAALLAASVLAAPAFAATTKTAEAPVIKASQAKTTPAKTNVKTNAKTDAKTSVLNANAKMSKHHVSHVRHHRHHNKIGAIKTHSKVSLKHTTHAATKRG
jgi:hypothetical protein